MAVFLLLPLNRYNRYSVSVQYVHRALVTFKYTILFYVQLLIRINIDYIED